MTDQPTAPPPPESTDTGPEVQAALSRMSPDPFVQAALWRVWYHGPGLLEASVSRLITEAYVRDHAATREQTRPTSIRRSASPCGNGGEHNPDCFDPDCPFDAPDPDAGEIP